MRLECHQINFATTRLLFYTEASLFQSPTIAGWKECRRHHIGQKSQVVGARADRRARDLVCSPVPDGLSCSPHTSHPNSPHHPHHLLPWDIGLGRCRCPFSDDGRSAWLVMKLKWHETKSFQRTHNYLVRNLRQLDECLRQFSEPLVADYYITLNVGWPFPNPLLKWSSFCGKGNTLILMEEILIYGNIISC